MANDLQAYTVSVKKTAANLEYVTFSNKEYPGPSNMSIGSSETQNNPASKDTLTPPKVGVNEVTPGLSYNYTDTAQQATSNTNYGLDTKKTDDVPVAAAPVSQAHTHPATDVIETKNRYFLTDDERYEIRELWTAKDAIQDSASKKLVVFSLPDLIEPGVHDIYVRFPWAGRLLSTYGVLGNVSMLSSTKYSIEACTQSELNTNPKSPKWTQVGNIQEIFMTELTTENNLGIIVSKNDHFRLNIISTPADVKGLTVELVILIDT